MAANRSRAPDEAAANATGARARPARALEDAKTRWSESPLRRGDLLYVPSARHLSCHGGAVVLRPAADAVLQQLIRSGIAVTRYVAFLAALDGIVAEGRDAMAALRGAVFALRHHLRSLGSKADIRVVSGVGYRLVPSGLPPGGEVRHRGRLAAWPGLPAERHDRARPGPAGAAGRDGHGKRVRRCRT